MKKIIVYRHQIKRPIYENYKLVKVELKSGKIYNIKDIIVSNPQCSNLLPNKHCIFPKTIQKDSQCKEKFNFPILRNELFIPLTYNRN